MNTALIDLYLSNLTSAKRETVIKTLENIMTLAPDLTVSVIFSLPGVTVDGAPVCSIKAEGKKIRLRFFQRELFNFSKRDLANHVIAHSSIILESPDEVLDAEVARLIRSVVMSSKIDASFKRSVERNSSGFYSSVSLSPKKKLHEPAEGLKEGNENE